MKEIEKGSGGPGDVAPQKGIDGRTEKPSGRGICYRCIRGKKACSLRPVWPVVTCATFEPDLLGELDRIRKDGERFREALQGDSEIAGFVRDVRDRRAETGGCR